MLVKQASDRCIIDPAGTSHVQKKANVFRQIRVTKITPQMSNLMIDVGPGGRLDLQVEDEVAILLLRPEGPLSANSRKMFTP